MTGADNITTHEKSHAILFETDGNVKPDHLQAGFIITKDLKKLRYALLAAQAEQHQGTVILLHGRNETIEKYYETIDDLHLRGFHVATMDWRGQGNSDRLSSDINLGYVRSFKDYADDLEQFFHSIVQTKCPPPYYILAHSAGGLITLYSMPRISKYIERVVLAAPLLGFDYNNISTNNLRRIASCLHYLGMGKTYVRKGVRPGTVRNFDNNPLTNDKIRFERNQQIIYNQPALGIAGPSFTWIYNALKAIHHLNKPKSIQAYKVPTLFIIAGDDKIVSSRSTDHYTRRIRAATAITIVGARHELLQEDDYYREQFWAAFDAFIPPSTLKSPSQP